ncbi:MAG: FKBP-type peptidyl-prolyl cis-trans isomerase [Flavobacteriales bacterium]|nr:FKBP-type peptidyl-prolyl cis-trans isomerase [Flavobacteriales bacterium]
MNKQLIRIGLLVLAVTFINVDANAQKKKKKKKKGKTEEVATLELKNELDSVSYAIGLNMTKGIQKDFSEGNFNLFVAGIKAGLGLDSSLISVDQLEKIIAPYFQKKQEAAKSEELKKSESVKVDGLKFLEENKKKEGVITTASGLQYVVLKEGEGEHPVATSNVEVHYHGTTPDGTVFDSSVDRGKTISFPLNGVIKGWTVGVQLMTVGAKYRFFIPQELAYGANPRPGGAIKPFMPLVFEVELFKITN